MIRKRYRLRQSLQYLEDVAVSLARVGAAADQRVRLRIETGRKEGVAVSGRAMGGKHTGYKRRWTERTPTATDVHASRQQSRVKGLSKDRASRQGSQGQNEQNRLHRCRADHEALELIRSGRRSVAHGYVLLRACRQEETTRKQHPREHQKKSRCS
jgi:hypothetical protein